MMFWAKVKMCVAALCAVAVVGAGTGIALSAASAGEKASGGKLRKEKDHAGREWQLEDWKEGSRPYKKDLKEREAEYLKKNGENWDGPVYGNRGHGDRIMSPGDWKWETVVTLAKPLSTDLKLLGAKHRMNWGLAWPFPLIYAAGAGEVTDIYSSAGPGFVHCDPKTKKVTFIGSPRKPGNKDGLGSEARITNRWGESPTVDRVSGRIYWLQPVSKTVNALRSVEKLLPYKANGKQYLLPAILEYKDLYKKVKGPGGGELEPVMKDGKRAEPSFAVRTSANFKNPVCPGSYRGKRVLLSPDGKGIWLNVQPRWPPTPDFDRTVLFEIDTGKRLEALKLSSPFPVTHMAQDGVGGHGGTCVGIDGTIYMSQHTGCGGGPARLFSIDPANGKITHLYDSVMGTNWGKRLGKHSFRLWDAPADALSLSATSTMHQTQCPRTGAIFNGGWDNTGIRQYLDGFVTSLVHGRGHKGKGRPGWSKSPNFNHHNCETAIAPNGDIYVPDVCSNPPRIFRMFRTDWPKEQPEYGYGEKFMPKAKLEKLMLEYAKKYIANYEANSKH